MHAFVYGTLKRGQCREACWPIEPISVQPAWTQGSLWAGPNYPAMRPGNDRVCGECWTLDDAATDETLRVLDAIEGTTQDERPNLYDRVRCEVFTLARRSDVVQPETPLLAWTYHYATHPEPLGFVRLVADENGWVSWSA